jgi:hypothetical protein
MTGWPPEVDEQLRAELAACQLLHPGWACKLTEERCAWATRGGFTLRDDSPSGLHVKIATWEMSHQPAVA